MFRHYGSLVDADIDGMGIVLYQYDRTITLIFADSAIRLSEAETEAPRLWHILPKRSALSSDTWSVRETDQIIWVKESFPAAEPW